MAKQNIFAKIYDKHYKALMIIPIFLLILSLGAIGYNYATTGDFINRGVSLKGGVQVTVFTEKNIDITALENVLSNEFPNKDLGVRGLQSAGEQVGFIVSADMKAENQEQLDPLIGGIEDATQMELGDDDYNVEIIGSTLGASFFQQTIKTLLIAFMFMGAVVFYYFANTLKVKLIAILVTIINGILIFKYFFTNITVTILSLIILLGLMIFYLKESPPSFAVILAVIADIVTTVAIVNLLGIKLSTAGIAAFLMLIGYSVDTDILLSTRVLKRNTGTVLERTYNAMKTGMVMSITTISAVIIALVITQSEILRQIMIIVLIGLIVDLIYTWIQNAGILRWYLE